MAKWSEVWTNRGITVKERQEVIDNLRNECPHKPVKKEGGNYPHLQKAKFDYGRPPKVYKNNPKKEKLS